MRKELLYNPFLLCERVAEYLRDKNRLQKLKGKVAQSLTIDHIDSLELLELLEPVSPCVIYDVGANVGTWTLLAKSFFPKAEIHCFEPLRALKIEFEKRTGSLENIHHHNIALGAENKILPMKVTDFIDASSLLDLTETFSSYYQFQHTRDEMVQVERLDDFVSRTDLPSPDLIKLDIQGYEVEALKGASRCMGAAIAVLAEVSFVEIYKGQCLFHEMVSLLAKQGFRLFALGRRTPVGKQLVQADALFVREELGDRL